MPGIGYGTENTNIGHQHSVPFILNIGSWDIVVSIVAKLWAGWLRSKGLIKKMVETNRWKFASSVK